jgi:hypothetical protein
LKCPWKQNAAVESKQSYSQTQKNDVRQVIQLDPGPLVDIEVDDDEHVYVINGQIGHNTINFLTGYGGGAHGLQATLAADSIYFTLEECEDFLEAFFDSYPGLRSYLAYYKQFISSKGVAVSILGRVRVFEEVFSDDKGLVNKALRAGCNHLIQDTASDMMLVCLCVIEELMRQDNLESVLVSTVHDSLVIDFYRPELPKLHEIVSSVFANIPEVMQLWFGPEFDLSWMIVPFAGDSELGLNYHDLRSIPKENIDWDALLTK